MLDSTTTSKLIREARRKAEMSQEQLAGKLYVTKQSVSNWERGVNLPDEQIRENIEKVLNIKLHKEKMVSPYKSPFLGTFPDLKPLGEMKSIDEIISSVMKIINSITIDSHERVIKKMLYLTLMELIGYEIYYKGHCRKFFIEEPLDWYTLAEELDSLIKDSDMWLIENTKHRLNYKNPFATKIEQMALSIGGELVEDFDDKGYRDDFVQQIGRYGQECGYSLVSLIPEYNTDIAIVYKSAIMDIIEMFAARS